MFRFFKTERLADHQRQQGVCRKEVDHFINHYFLIGPMVPGDGEVLVLSVAGKEKTVKLYFFLREQ
jgi:hypothetical protein